MYVRVRTARPLADLCVALGVAFILFLLNACITFTGPIHDFFAGYSRYPVVEIFINMLVFWLAVLLVVAFRRWHNANRQSRELENVLSSISPDALVVIDHEERVVLCNDSIRRLLGHDPAGLIGQPASNLYRHWRLGSDAPDALQAALAKDGLFMGTAIGRGGDGQDIPIELIVADLADGTGRVMLLRDTRERLAAQSRRRELQERVDRWERLDSLAQVAGRVARDFSVALESIHENATRSLERLPRTNPARTKIEGLIPAVRRAQGLCAQMLAYSGQGPVSPENVDLSEAARDAFRSLRVPLARTLTIRLAVASALPPVRGDSLQVRQAIANLIENASEALGDEEGTLVVTTGVEECGSNRLAGTYVDDRLPAGTYAFVEVADTGPGMTDDVRLRAFDPFFTTRFTGRGLGLAVVLGVVRGLRGAVSIDSAPGQGTRVRLLFPVVP